MKCVGLWSKTCVSRSAKCTLRHSELMKHKNTRDANTSLAGYFWAFFLIFSSAAVARSMPHRSEVVDTS